MCKLPCLILLCPALILASSCHGCWVPDGVDVAGEAGPPSLNASIECTSTIAKKQYSEFVKALRKYHYATACADHWWLRHVAALKLKAKETHAVVMDVGCNKGFFSGAALNYLAPGYGDHLQKLYKSHLSRRIYSKPCGACSECKQGRPEDVPKEGQQSVDVLCFEPSEIHVDSMIRARDKLYGKPPATSVLPRQDGSRTKTRVNFHVLHEAVSNHTGTALFPSNCSVNTCSVGSSSTPAFTGTSNNSTTAALVEVKVTTVDAVMASRGLSYIDVLKIDTEGFDPAVLAGAYHSLRAHHIGAISFEYHFLWGRSGSSLRQCLSYLEDLGYDCFYDAAVLARISGLCWVSNYEMRRWSNVVCAVRGSPLEVALAGGSYLAGAEAQAKGWSWRTPKDRRRADTVKTSKGTKRKSFASELFPFH